MLNNALIMAKFLVATLISLGSLALYTYGRYKWGLK